MILEKETMVRLNLRVILDFLCLYLLIDFAEYTSAKERIALGKKARKKEAESRRSAIQELINDA